MAKYTVHIGGHSWAQGPVIAADTITAGRKAAEDYGNTADWADIRDAKGRTVASHRRSTDGNGMRWYKAVVVP